MKKRAQKSLEVKSHLKATRLITSKKEIKTNSKKNI